MDDDELEPWEDDGADFPVEGEADRPVVEEPDDEDEDSFAVVPPADVDPQTDVASPSGGGLFAAAPVAAPSDEAVAPLALYRRYRPDTFAEIIGQDHVTKPLQRALANNRVNHAYLFSGPRGCGKTTSARILARALNCENGPAAEPCGHCRSCRDLATGGPGSIDVIEIDAASHGGVDDARDLREKAFFAPVASRYKIYIIDEAHMVTTQGFNALLKLVEEPPPHVKFIFATTEPDKVIGTIRSRTHHYPFRLVPPKALTDYLAGICAEEGIATETGVLPLVVRAGGGSVRDAMSVLDQLLGGASAGGVTYEHATSLLGYTPDDLLDTMVDAFAAGDGSGVFSVVERVIEAGQDPRRFAEDLLRRMRDLVIVAAVPDALATGLVEVTPGQAETYASEAAAMGLGELTRAADVIAEGLTQMRGTTAPRLHLELMCARVLLPGADVAERGTNARLDRIERRLNLGGLDTGVPVGDVPGETTSATGQRPRGPRRDQQNPVAGAPTPAAELHAPEPHPPDQHAPERPPRPPRPESPAPTAQQPGGEQPQQPPHRALPDVPGSQSLTTQDAHDRWGDLLAAVGRRRNFTKVLLEGNAVLVSLVGGVLTLALGSPGARASFERPRERQAFMEAATEVFGTVLQVDTIINPDAGRQGRGGRGAGPSGPSGAGGPGGRTPAGGPGPGSAPATARPPARPPRGAVPDGAPGVTPSQPSGDHRSATVPTAAPPAAATPAPAAPAATSPAPRPRGTRRGAAAVAPVAPPRDDVPPPPEPPEDPWDEPPPEEDPYVPRQVNAPAPAPSVPAPTVPAPTVPRSLPRPTAPAGSDDRSTSTPPRPSRYSQVAAGPAPPTALTPEEEAAAYSDEDTTVGEGYENASELLTNVLGAELILEEAQDGNQV